MAKEKAPEFELPEELGNEYHPYRLQLRIRVKQLEDDVTFKGEHAKAGEYIGRASDGGEVHLTEEELLAHYETVGAE